MCVRDRERGGRVGGGINLDGEAYQKWEFQALYYAGCSAEKDPLKKRKRSTSTQILAIMWDPLEARKAPRQAVGRQWGRRQSRHLVFNRQVVIIAQI